jgi:death-on-curing protein
MDKIFPELRAEYEGYKRIIGPDPLEGKMLINADDVLRAHFLIVDTFIREGEPIVLSGPRDINLLLSAIVRPIVGLGNILKWNSEYERCATLFFGLIKNHPFHDGNKRTAFLVALYYLLKIRRLPDKNWRAFEKIAERTASNELNLYKNYRKFSKKPDSEILYLADFFKKNTRETNKRLYLITFNELKKILEKYHYHLKNPGGNSIDVVKYEEQRSGLFMLKTRIVEKKVTTIGFPRWTAQVSIGDLHRVLKETGLTPENGYDSEVIFKEAESLDALIDMFHGPLRRLKDK